MIYDSTFTNQGSVLDIFFSANINTSDPCFKQVFHGMNMKKPDFIEDEGYFVGKIAFVDRVCRVRYVWYLSYIQEIYLNKIR